ncbi:MAG: hypothetical protein PVH25_13130 [Burkholderiales bacterium]
MAAEDRVNSAQAHSDEDAGEPGETRPRWWLRNPPMGVLSAAILGVATALLAASLKAPDHAPGSTLLYLVILPIALLLPAVALAGMVVAWRALRASHGTQRLILVIPATAAIVLNALAAGLFARWLTRVFVG